MGHIPLVITIDTTQIGGMTNVKTPPHVHIKSTAKYTNF